MIFPNFCKLSKENSLPPTLYAIMNSIVNFDSEERIKISDLASYAHSNIFDFNYPLSANVNKDDFETMILNKFIMRRIGFDTVTTFKIMLNVKLNEIMPNYNKIFDAMENWNLFDDGEVLSRRLETNSNSTINQISNSTSDRRYSELPQNQLNDLENGSYVTEYNLDKNTFNSNNTDNSTGAEVETVTKSESNKVMLLNEFISKKNNVMTMIYNDLDELFYQLI